MLASHMAGTEAGKGGILPGEESLPTGRTHRLRHTGERSSRRAPAVALL